MAGQVKSLTAEEIASYSPSAANSGRTATEARDNTVTASLRVWLTVAFAPLTAYSLEGS